MAQSHYVTTRIRLIGALVCFNMFRTFIQGKYIPKNNSEKQGTTNCKSQGAVWRSHSRGKCPSSTPLKFKIDTQNDGFWKVSHLLLFMDIFGCAIYGEYLGVYHVLSCFLISSETYILDKTKPSTLKRPFHQEKSAPEKLPECFTQKVPFTGTRKNKNIPKEQQKHPACWCSSPIPLKLILNVSIFFNIWKKHCQIQPMHHKQPNPFPNPIWLIHPWRVTWNLKKHQIEKENHLPNLHFWGSMLIFQGVYRYSARRLQGSDSQRKEWCDISPWCLRSARKLSLSVHQWKFSGMSPKEKQLGTSKKEKNMNKTWELRKDQACNYKHSPGKCLWTML